MRKEILYECEENDNHLIFDFDKVEAPDEIEEIRVGDCLKKNWIVIGFNDLVKALNKVGYAVSKIGIKNYQERVIEEERTLYNKMVNLSAFKDTDTYKALSFEEKRRLIRQLKYMELYQSVLEERIEAFEEN